MLKTAVIFLLLFIVMPLSAQEMSDEYEQMFGEREAFDDPVADAISTPSLLSGTSLFGGLSRYNFNFISYRNRGYDGRNVKYYIKNLDVSPVTDKYPDYSFYSSLKASVPRTTEFFNSAAAARIGGSGSVFHSIDPSDGPHGFNLRAAYSEIHYRGGVSVSAAGSSGKGWDAALNARYRGGGDKFIGGVFSDSWLASGAAGKDIGKRGRLTLFCMGASSSRGIRSWTVGEVFRLTGDNLYNPSWGWYSGRRRNSNVRSDVNGLFTASYGQRAGITYITVSAMYRYSERIRGRLVWQNAASVMPDHYANLPSYYPDPIKAQQLARLWMTDPNIRQIDWGHIMDANLHSSDGSVYIVGEDVSRTNILQAAVSAVSRFSDTFELGYGLRFSRDGNAFYRRAADMLGGEYYHDDVPGSGNAEIRQGDKFEYDFRIPRTAGSAYVSGYLEKGKWSGRFDIELARTYFSRYGNASSVLNADSYAGSERTGFTTYDIKLGGDYRFSASHVLSSVIWAGSRSPAYQEIFTDPRSGNHIIPDITGAFAAGAEITYRGALSRRLTFELSAYYTRTARETDVYGYYDNVGFEYMIASLTDISKCFTGIEAAIEADITRRLSVAAGASFGKYVYSGGASAAFYRPDTMELLAKDEACHIGGLVCSPSPQTLAVISATYSIPYTWSFGASFVYGGARYVAINPVRRTDRILAAASSPETRQDFLTQERLPAASVVNLTVSRRFRLGGCYAYAGVTVNNLFGKNDMVYGGYEQMRIAGSGSGAERRYSPSPSRYAYCYPRSIYATVSVNF